MRPAAATSAMRLRLKPHLPGTKAMARFLNVVPAEASPRLPMTRYPFADDSQPCGVGVRLLPSRQRFVAWRKSAFGSDWWQLVLCGGVATIHRQNRSGDV